MGCNVDIIQSPVEVTWLPDASAEAGHGIKGAYAILLVVNTSDERQRLRVDYQTDTGENSTTRKGPVFDLDPAAKREIRFDPREHGARAEGMLVAGSATVSVTLLSRARGPRRAVSSELRFHPDGGDWLFYGDAAARDLHAGGDFAGSVMAGLPPTENSPISVAHGVRVTKGADGKPPSARAAGEHDDDEGEGGEEGEDSEDSEDSEGGES
ncbi:MAG: hypothetical protein V3V08_07470 [Nannocystaceae bacterium]